MSYYCPNWIFDVLTGAVAAPVHQPSYQRKYNKLSGSTVKMEPLPTTIVKVIDADRKAGLSLLEVSMEEVLPQQMQRMCMQVLKCPMLSIKRTEFGPIRLSGLKRAQWRELTSSEVEKLKGSGDYKLVEGIVMDEWEDENGVVRRDPADGAVGDLLALGLLLAL